MNFEESINDLLNKENNTKNLFLELLRLNEDCEKDISKSDMIEINNDIKREENFNNLLYIWIKTIVCGDKTLLNMNGLTENERLIASLTLSKNSNKQMLMKSIRNNDINEYLRNIFPLHTLKSECESLTIDNLDIFIQQSLNKLKSKEEISILIPPFSFDQIINTIKQSL